MPKRTPRNYALASSEPSRPVPIPRLDYAPPQPRHYRPRLGLIGCGGIAATHLQAYRTSGWNVVALSSRRPEAIQALRAAFYPHASGFTDYRDLLRQPDIDVVDITLPAQPRARVIADALRAGKHVLSQKPLAANLATAQRLVQLARDCGRHLAVNQNGRWAPYVRWMTLAVQQGLIGNAQSASISLNWDHTWTRTTPLAHLHHLVLFDFAIHWFDIATVLLAGKAPRRVFAVTQPAQNQPLKPPLLASAVVEFDHALATLHFDAHSRVGPQERICLTGSTGTLRAQGPVCAAHDLTLHTRRGTARPQLTGTWFNDGFRGTMGELLCAIEEHREPSHAAANNLRSLEICLAALRSADTGRPVLLRDPASPLKSASRRRR